MAAADDTSADGALLVLGGRSEIGGEVAVRLCAGREVVLAARNAETDENGRLAAVAARLSDAGAKNVHRLDFDASELASHRKVIEQAIDLAGDITTAVVAFGILGDQQRAEHDETHAADIAVVDYAAQVSVLTVLADVMQRGTIVAFSSIAGWRARRANYVYGSCKAGLDAFCQGLTDRLHSERNRHSRRSGQLALITARPGFVIGAMTTGMKPAPLSVTPDVVAEHVVAGMRTKGGAAPRSSTVWIPGRLRLLAWAMKIVPRPLWRRMPR